MKRSIGEGRVELGIERHVRRIGLDHIQPDRPSRRDQFGRIVDADNIRAALDDLVRESAVAAADVENPLTQLRVKQVERGLTEVGNEAADPGIVRSIPATGRGDCSRQSVFTQSR